MQSRLIKEYIGAIFAVVLACVLERPVQPPGRKQLITTLPFMELSREKIGRCPAVFAVKPRPGNDMQAR